MRKVHNIRTMLLAGAGFLLAACQHNMATQQPAAEHLAQQSTMTSEPARQHHPAPTGASNALLAQWVAQASRQIAAAPAHYQLQVIYSAIQRRADGSVILDTSQYRADAEYLYPASTVKLAIAALALEYVEQLAVPGLDLDSPMHTAALLPDDLPILQDTTAAAGFPSVRHYVKKILLVSDNDAYNRLYELMGQQYINQRLAQLGFQDAQILHRLERALTPAQNRHTNAVSFYDQHGKLLYQQPARLAPPLTARSYTPVGQGYMSNGVLHSTPLDFSQKNRWTLTQMHRMTQLIMLPTSIPEQQRLQLRPAHLQFLQQQMAQLVTDSRDPHYAATEFWPSYVKFLIYGADKQVQPNPRLHIHNKVGDAYGFLLDSAYVHDADTGSEFLLSAALYVNQDGVLNDDKYEYETVGLPFLKRLGELALAHAKHQQQCARSGIERQCALH